MKNKCANPRCNNEKPIDRYACFNCWRRIPGYLQRAIVSGFNKGRLSAEWLAAHERVLQEHWKRH